MKRILSLRRRTLIVSAVSLLSLLLLAGFAGRGWHGGCHGGDPHKFIDRAVDRMLDKLDATDAQRTEILAVKDDLMSKAEPLRAGREEFRDQMKSIMSSDDPNPEELHAMIDAKIDQLRQFAHEAADSALEVHDTLTPEQRAELMDRIESFHGKGCRHGGFGEPAEDAPSK